ncbi:DNA replication/repair protein RecF [Inquilinus sp. NPDC058860]|uniref:DNA replication/repair protein RecF n=1 Tax=Inquilinus sp. NPDC058860 TaxID=3346652 RepID=UPI003694A2F5
MSQDPMPEQAAASSGRTPGAGGRIAVTRLTLTEFRCYGQLRIELDPRPVVLTGPNGAGKTNLLEAVSFLSPGRGLRRAPLPEVTRRQATGGAGWAVAARLLTPTGEIALGTRLEPGEGRRAVQIDGRPAQSQAAFGARAPMVWLTPQMDRLFGDAASQRRRFLDRLVFGFHPDHAGQLGAYERAMRERNRLLKEPRADPAWLAALEDTMATSGTAVAAARRELVARLRGAESLMIEGPFPRAELAVEGRIEAWLEDRPAVDAEEAFRNLLCDNRRIDAAAGAATEGPHRSDLSVHHRTKAMPAAQCSTGEQKALLIGIVLANARLLAGERGAPPLLLLDEVAAHLDEARRAALYEEILALGAQAWMTGTDPALFAPLGDRAHHLGVDDARVAARDAV